MMARAPEGLLRGFLTAMEARDLQAAQSFLSPRFSMQGPGGGMMRTLDELIDWAKPRYRSVAKQSDRFDVSDDVDAKSVVYCFGTLSGVWTNGEEFTGIRFIDRFSIEHDRIVDQKI
jgi:hypothetical protein